MVLLRTVVWIAQDTGVHRQGLLGWFVILNNSVPGGKKATTPSSFRLLRYTLPIPQHPLCC